MRPIILKPIRFTYPWFYHTPYGIAGIVFIVAAIWITLLPGMGYFFLFFFGGFSLGFLYVWYAFSAKIYLDSDGITKKQIGVEIKIRYIDIIQVKQDMLQQGIVISSMNHKIDAGRLLNNYDVFYSLFMQFVPANAINKDYQVTLPLQISTHWWLKTIYLSLAALGLFFLYLTIRDAAWFDGLMATGVFLFSGLGFYLFTPDKYFFEHEQVTVFYPFRRKSYSWHALQEFDIEDIQSQMLIAQLLTLTFDNGKVIIQNLFIDYPLETLHEILVKRLSEINSHNHMYHQGTQF